jgi:hypothetical protein
VRMYDEYHHTTTHARMMYIIIGKNELECVCLVNCLHQLFAVDVIFAPVICR